MEVAEALDVGNMVYGQIYYLNLILIGRNLNWDAYGHEMSCLLFLIGFVKKCA